ncbi:ComEA family DNA-binding protein [Cellvibrio polysaccharolyticus]|nr:ComEA family DNA-binding protein [Cellvibrio polysaccharolyticus]
MKTLSAIFVAILILIASPAFATDDNTATESFAAQLAVNINSADVETLTQLKGVGEKKAADIVAWRDANGTFTSVEQLLEVRGIGPAILESNRDRIQL